MSMELVRQEDASARMAKDFDDERQVFFPEMKHTVAAFSQILGQQMETSMREIDFFFLNMQRGYSTEGLNIDSLQVAPSNSVENSKDSGLETDEEDYELIPGKIAQ